MTASGQTLEYRIAAAAAGITWSGLTQARRQRYQRCVIDYLGCVVAGSDYREVGPALALAKPGSVRIPGFDAGFDMTSAALVFGTSGALLQLHDIYAPGALHPGSAILAASWAVWRPSSDPIANFMRAVAAGYEVMNRVAAATFPAQQVAGFTPTATMGALGAAVAAGLLLGLDEDGLARALGNAAMLCPMTPFQTLCAHGSAVPMHGGFAARCGVEAALVAAGGWSAGAGALEGREGLSGWLGMLGANIAALVPENWDGGTVDQVIWKLFPACGAGQPTVEAALRLPALDPAEVRAIEIRLPGNSSLLVGGGPRPEKELYDRLMSVRWAVARALVDQDYGVSTLSRPDHPDVDRLIALMTVTADPALNPVPPRPLVATALKVALHDGRVHDIVHRRPRLGPFHDGRPVGWIHECDDEVLDSKFNALTAAKTAIAAAAAAPFRSAIS